MTNARELWRILEPLHGMIYFVPEGQQRYAALGLDRTAGYFASRAAALGPVSAEVVIATFYNFNPTLVHGAIPAAWEKTTPEALLAARLDAADTALRRGLGDLVTQTGELGALARRAAEKACETPQGRPLFAAHAALPWPEEPLLALWWAQTLLREYRGDGHLAALLLEGLSGIEALVVHSGSGEVTAEALRRTRGWSTEEWSAAVDGLRVRRLVDGEGVLTEAGLELRARVEGRTDEMAEGPYTVLDQTERERYVELARPLSRAIVAAGLLPFKK
ncbi:SCO6745 family protein [Umezawaea sp. Da 62-37]|uniref:SCO6745 family protein n=1 Tax=Umezawaea sp. Da 62-37 TaxID=3075927 RepID=UPI0028F747CF|nr:hypothetical protein [Umezawaea sp. Da 62-37]WNV86635.1 hypothetical protein RM788_52410 [Umezawaea sp. Da 62-37]WNV86782.1 hypothetical protein RM788_00400 [Umezawaea sp. Da 62-37]